MKAITLYQPWASLLACGAKKYETRSWAINYRGQIAIHAAKKDSLKALDNVKFEIWDAMLKALNIESFYQWDDAHLGHIIATAELIACHEIKRNIEDDAIYIRDAYRMFEHWLSPKDNEFLFGDWTPGRYAWEFANMKMLSKPILARGHQRLWEWEE